MKNKCRLEISEGRVDRRQSQALFMLPSDKKGADEHTPAHRRGCLSITKLFFAVSPTKHWHRWPREVGSPSKEIKAGRHQRMQRAPLGTSAPC